MSEVTITDKVRQRYADAARSLGTESSEPACCSPDQNQQAQPDTATTTESASSGSSECCSDNSAAFDTADSTDFGTWLYQADQLETIPDGAALASLGCGNPTAVAELHEGETVLDLGSGAGIDVLLSAKRVGPTGYAYGLDMTDEMLRLARSHQDQAGATNVEFLKGLIEDIPLDAGSVDVVISNCVINLSADKPAVFREMYRVLRPGGRLGLADVVADDSLTTDEKLERGSWVGCVAGALGFAEYESGLRLAGFKNISIEPTHTVAGGMHSAIIKATKE